LARSLSTSNHEQADGSAHGRVHIGRSVDDVPQLGAAHRKGGGRRSAHWPGNKRVPMQVFRIAGVPSRKCIHSLFD